MGVISPSKELAWLYRVPKQSEVSLAPVCLVTHALLFSYKPKVEGNQK
jgi:hypothetical protein